jgi:hypothetical protein
MGSTSDESTTKSDDGTDGLRTDVLEKLGPSYDIGHTRARQ